jgi:glycosyltransferase involved in cell wall biosynthesis
MSQHSSCKEPQKPLVTFAIIAYNQEDYIRDAVEAAFSQTYTPLQIVISDDCSTDKTFKTIKEMASAYSGPHEICINRNDFNKNIGGNVNSVMHLANGQLIVIAAGDDVSEPNRVNEIIDCWKSAGNPMYASIVSGVFELDSKGKKTCLPAITKLNTPDSLYIFKENFHFHGSSQAWTKATFEFFGDLLPGVVNEDSAIFYRNRLIGKILSIEKSLVNHRKHEFNAGSAGWSSIKSAQNLLDFFIKCIYRRKKLIENILSDINVIRQKIFFSEVMINPKAIEAHKINLLKDMEICERFSVLLRGSFFKRFKCISFCIFSNLKVSKFVLSKSIPILFPKIYLYLHFLKHSISNK